MWIFDQENMTYSLSKPWLLTAGAAAPGISAGTFSAARGLLLPAKRTTRSLSVIKKEFEDYSLMRGYLSVDLDELYSFKLQAWAQLIKNCNFE